MAKQRMGFEGQIFRGTAGATAATQIKENITDIQYNLETETAVTTDRGDGTVVPFETQDVVLLRAAITFTMLNKDSDAALTAFRTAMTIGGPVALRLKDFSSGKGFDGDVTMSMEHGKGLGDRQELNFTATPTKQSGRTFEFFK